MAADAKKKELIHRKKKKDPDSYRTFVKKISVSESDIAVLKDRARQAGMRLATYCYSVLIGKYAQITDVEHKMARIAVTTIIGNFTQILNHPNVDEFLSEKDTSTLKKISRALGYIIMMDVYISKSKSKGSQMMDDKDDTIDDADKLKMKEAKKRNPLNKRTKQLKVSISKKEKEQLTARAVHLDLKLSQYIYYRIMSKQLRFVPHVKTRILQKIAGYAGVINDISHKYNIENTLTKMDVKTLMDAVKQIGKTKL